MIRFRVVTILALAALSCGPVALAEDSPELAAAAAVGSFIEAWNTGDNDALRATINFPFMTMFGPGRLDVAEEAGDFSVDFGQMREREDWARSELVPVGAPIVTEEQVHIEARFSRFNSAGEEYRKGMVYYIVTKQDGHWGIQYRSGFVPDANDPEAGRATRKAIDEFFVAWNAGDNEAIHEVINFPHAFLVRGGRVSVADGPDELMTNFEGMRQGEGWHESRFHGLDIALALPDKVFARLTFTRHHEDGTIYRTVPVLWIFTKQDGHWGIQLRAILGEV